MGQNTPQSKMVPVCKICQWHHEQSSFDIQRERIIEHKSHLCSANGYLKCSKLHGKKECNKKFQPINYTLIMEK